MRKILAIILLFVVCIPVTIYADDIDLSAMTDAEFVEFFAQVNQELVNRGIEKSATFLVGTYIPEKDIPRGQYIGTPIDDPETKSKYIMFCIKCQYPDEHEYELYGRDFQLERNGGSFIFKIDENVTEVEFARPCKITIYAGPKFE